MAFVNGGKQEHHVFVELALGVPLANAVDAFDDDLINHLTGVPVNQRDPLVDQISFLVELDLNCLQHLNTSYDVMQSLFRRLLLASLVHQEESLDMSFQLSCHL